MRRLKIRDISSYSDAKKELALHSVASLVGTGIDALLVYLINKNFDNEVLRIIGIALFGVAGVEAAISTIIYTGALGYAEIQDIKERLAERKNNR